jgi:two-component system, NtrC family, nitrogen regulation sensor histidine kinase NtrY
MFRRFNTKHCLAALLSLLVIRYLYNYSNRWDASKTQNKLQEAIIDKEQSAYKIIDELCSVKDNKHDFHKFDHLVNNDYHIQIYNNQQLFYWNSNAIPPSVTVSNASNASCVTIANGIYERIAFEKHTWKYIIYAKIYNDYPYENSFLKNGFTNSFVQINNKAVIEINKKNAAIITSKNGDYLFSLRFKTPNESNYSSLTIALDAAIIVTLLLLLSLIISRYIHKSLLIKNTTIAICIVVVRGLLLYFKFPQSIYSTALFNPAAFASNVLFASLGDALLNSITMLFIYLLTIRLINNKVLINATIVFTCVLLIGNLYMVELLVRDSQITFDLFNFFTISTQTFTALFLIAFNFVICCVMLQHLFKTMDTKHAKLVVISFVAISVALAIIHNYTYIVSAFTIIVCWYSNKYKNKHLLYFVGLIIVANAITVVLKINQLVNDKEKTYRKSIVEKLAEEQDAIAENLILPIIYKIERDSVLRVIANQKNFKGDIKKYIIQKYFAGYWEKYNIQTHLFNPSGEPVLIENINEKKDISQYENEIKSVSTLQGTSEFVFINNKNEQNYYVGKFNLHDAKTLVNKGTLYITLKNKLLADEIGFPDLLLDSKIETQINLYNYSYARYQNKELVTKIGAYNYPLKSVFNLTTIGDEQASNDDKYNHYTTYKNDNVSIVLSKHKANINDYIGAIIYILLLLLASYMLVWLLFNYSNIKLIYAPSLRQRIQLTFFFILIATIVVISYGTITIVTNQYQQKNETLISEKIHSVLISLEQTFGAETKLSNIDADYLNYNLSRLANVFYTDINVFDTQGRLIASSQPKLFNQGIISTLMNNDAYTQLIEEKKTSHTQNETIGELNFLSSYLPFENNNNNVIGYINLPYFAKQNELAKEVSGYVVTLINLFLLLFVIVFIITFLLANRLMAPLLEVQEKMSQLQLGIQNEHISYNSSDEIGRLVNEYNRMVDELALSANKLVQSEREGAWREMAKQVAHEIKNPLTPMKLSVQQLQRTLNVSDVNWQKMFEKTSHNLIEQIDTLSNIATEFSNFAKLPEAHYELTDVALIMQQVIGLYEAESNLKITLVTNANTTKVLGDKDYLNRIFNNLIKNAQQAIENFVPQTEQGIIHITLKNVHLTTLQISIKDNGGGIPTQVQEKLFTPYFTTKSKGTGLGLAMVKKMVEQMRGEISYTTIINHSTTFVLLLPSVK